VERHPAGRCGCAGPAHRGHRGGAPAHAARAELLGLLKLPAGALAGAVRAALNKPIHRALRDYDPGPNLVHAMLDAGGEAMLGVLDDCILLERRE
jgi:hypothetical protein